ncbi:uncharacterized protein LOC124648930 [Lolium rigidum]|uniref:uncharacterized protein LOC124648930 n=1 Tax=Lolium rigidum TaxID=89674 RepID=UPI001F5CAD0D|nr:uncharacterized protein LOC124648930 [Lolium rigidum]
MARGETQVLDDGGTPPLGSPVVSGDTTRSEGGGDDDDGMLYGDTQALDDDDETQAVDDEFEEQEEEAAAGETQLIEDSEEEGVDVAGQTQAVEVEEDEDGGSTEDEAGGGNKTQLLEECEAEGGGNKTQLVQECQEEERVNDSGDEADAIDWGMTQRVEDTDEEVGDDGDDELSEGTQVQSDDEGLQNDERDVEEHDDVADSDASTDEEGGTAREAFTIKSLEQGKRQPMANGTFPLTEIVENSTSCGTSLGGCPDRGIDDGSYGYVQSHGKDGSKSKGRCPTAKKLFADTATEQSESKSRRFSGLSYLNSQEPGDLSQANALEVVEGLISINGGLSSQEPTPKKLGKAKPPVSIKMGTLQLAEKVDRCRSSNGKPEIFAWVDSQEDDGGGEFFSKNKDVLLHQSTGKRKSKIPRPKKCSTKIAPVDTKKREYKSRTDSNVRGKIETLPSSDSRLLESEVKSKRTSGKRSKKNLLNDLGCLSNAKPVERQQEKVSVNLHDVGQDTQMAVLAIEALAQSSPAENLSAEDELPVNRDLRVGSRAEKSQSKNGPPRKRTSSIQEGVMTRSKRIKVTELNQKPQKKRQRGIQSQENLEDCGTKTKNKQAKSVQEKNKIAKIVDGNKYASTPIAHRTRHTGRNSLFEYSELGPNKHLKKGMNLTGDNSTTGEVRNNHTAHEPERPMLSERTGYGSGSVVKESTKHTCANQAQNLQQNNGASIQHTSANVSENLESFRDEPATHVSRREPSSHPKQRRTPRAKLQAKAPAVTQTATDHEIQPEVVRSPRKRRVFIKRSELLTYARREPSKGSMSMLSSIIPQSSAVSPILNSSKGVNNKSSGFGSSDQRQKEPSGVRDASNSPESNSPVPNSVLKTPSKMVNKLSPTFSPLNPSKASRSLSKPSIARELLELDPENTLSSRHRKDSRRKDMASASILFSHHLDEDVIKRQKKILARLGVREAFSVSDATHFVADGFFRTKNMLEAIALGKLVVTSMWLESCGEAGCYVNDKKYILRDAKKEKEIGFSMPISLASASKHPLLLGKRVFVTQNVKPSRQVLTCLVSASSGQPLERIGRSINKEREAPDDLLVISCEEDYETCAALLEKGVNVYEAELILNGIVTQKLEYDRHRLFSDRVRQTRSTRWLKDNARGQFVPVSRS